MKFYLLLVLSTFLFFGGCKSKRPQYDRLLTGHLPNSAETAWIYSTEDIYSDENYLFNEKVRKADLLLVDSTIIYTTRNQKIIALNANTGKCIWHTNNHPKRILSIIADTAGVYYLYTLDQDSLILIALNLKTGTKKWKKSFDNQLIPDETTKERSRYYYDKLDTLNILTFNKGNLLISLAQNLKYFNQANPYIIRVDKSNGKVLKKNRVQFQYNSSLPAGNSYIDKNYMMIDYQKNKAFMFGRIGIHTLSDHDKDTALLYIRPPAVNKDWFVYEYHRTLVGNYLKGSYQWEYKLPTSIAYRAEISINDTLVIFPLDYVCMGNPCYSKLAILDVRTGIPIVEPKLIGYSHPTASALIDNKLYIALDPEPVSIESKTDCYILEIEIPSGKYLRIFRMNRGYFIDKFIFTKNNLFILNSHGEVISMKLLKN
jgi:hypothetical protein